MSDDGGTAYLCARLDVVELRVRRALAERRRADPRADADPYRGWYVGEQTVTRLLDRTRPAARRRYRRARDRDPGGAGRRRYHRAGG